MFKLLIGCVFAIIISPNIFAQAPSIQWSKCYGGYDIDRAYGIVQVDDGGFIIVGVAFSDNGDVVGLHDDFGAMDDVWIIKLDTLGNLQWQKCLGGSISEGAYSISKTFDGGFILVGYASSDDHDVSGNHGIGNDYWLVKTDSNANIQWQKCFGGSDFEWAYSVIQTSDSGYAVIGEAQSTDGDVTGNHGNDIWIVKTNGLGNLEWENAIGGWGHEKSVCIHQKLSGS